ncbi:MAG: HAMP domain-containing histidine kinase [Synechococcaceae cyanobacterium SM2_3_2]|nr:HAMP domain-containing histidine kinase [Synechococcaceae cyanobacterium SM2_3_2]
MTTLCSSILAMPLSSPHRLRLVALFVIILMLEYLTPVPYVFGYLYTGPILLSGKDWIRLTIPLSILLTLSNLWIPDPSAYSSVDLLNRLIACLALAVTGILAAINQERQQTLLQQQAQLQAAQHLVQIREDFDATLTHDLKTPLLGSLETLSLLLQGHFGSLSPAQKQVLSIMARSQRTTLQLVETLVDVYRIDLEGLHLHPETVDIFALAEDTAASLTDLATHRRITLRVSPLHSEFRPTLLLQGDPLQLRRVLSNLLINAIQHSPRGGRVDLKLGSDGHHCSLQVLDQGQGIPPPELPHLFERFYQGENQRQTTGTGLGLYLSRQIIEAHHGKIWAENRPHRGAKLEVRIPFYP